MFTIGIYRHCFLYVWNMLQLTIITRDLSLKTFKQHVTNTVIVYITPKTTYSHFQQILASEESI